MNWFVCNYMNLVVNMLHMLLMLSLSMSTALPDTRKNFHMNLAVTTVTLISDWSVSDVHVILPFICDFHIQVDCSTRTCACPSSCVFLAELGLIRFNLELIFTFFSLRSVRTSHASSLTLCISHTLNTNRVILLASVRHHSQGITLPPNAGTPTPNGLRPNWDFLPGRSLWHVGGSNTVKDTVVVGSVFVTQKYTQLYCWLQLLPWIFGDMAIDRGSKYIEVWHIQILTWEILLRCDHAKNPMRTPIL